MTTHLLGTELPEDNASLRAALETLRQAPVMDLRSRNIALTKKQLAASVTPDLLIINAINTVEELDKVANALAKRLREWYALHDPELEHAYQDHQAFVDAVLTKTGSRSDDTMGGQLTAQDVEAMLAEAGTLSAIYSQRATLLAYLETTMQQHAPNIKHLAGASIGAKLMSMAGSLQRLSRLPSSTIQLLGAETALFRHLRNKRARPPKHGIIFNHVLLQRAPRDMRGKVARALADKLSIAAKIDFFKGEFIGDKLYAEVEAKVKI